MHIPGFGPRQVIEEDRHVIGLEDRLCNATPTEQPQAAHLGLQNSPVGLSAYLSEDTVIDLLCENQRGAFLCGSPMFSSMGLWITDPHAWTTPHGRYTPFNILNATLPDPSWEWTWPRWFVDMSGDVDENGWMYNINFTRHHWHGHHLWYHSFVRRRRWLRKRRKKQGGHVHRRVDETATGYTATVRSAGYETQQGASIMQHLAQIEQEVTVLSNLGDFYTQLRGCRLDREKLEAVDQYLHQGQDLYALAGEVKTILRFMIFQDSRRQLLALLSQHCQELEKEHAVQHEEQAAAADDHDSRHACVADAVDVAELLIAKLDYWSDRQILTRIEEDAELDRIMAVKLDEQAKKRKPPDLDALHVAEDRAENNEVDA
ncbi:hypothetical protein BCR37DRAFT_158626 [Protomyces lactucae-debilis]|uniref:Peroxin/Ferlin domain-containing protein n=1 Tax=Protomyces lactucae-debilis TaxID=2754530 RepID=A0A1Y2EZI4_PROLT|nr:uncharacterized protein BCR37DRAFT_158626 [Protomyces lactucae-debilis]ORY77009.1 hypothetical protein BCR37DRAFT_158626 [Protomyces lactucae-debilis]